MTDQLAKILEQDAEASARRIAEDAKRDAEKDDEQDQQEEEQAVVGGSRMNQDLADVDAVDEESVGQYAAGELVESDGAVIEWSAEDFERKVRDASDKALLLSRSVVRQTFGTVEMDDENEYAAGVAGVAGGIEGEVHQQFGNVKIGSKNKVKQGIYR